MEKKFSALKGNLFNKVKPKNGVCCKELKKTKRDKYKYKSNLALMATDTTQWKL